MEILQKHFPKSILVKLPGPTRGAAETVLFGLEGMPATLRDRPVMLVDGDTIYTYDIVSAYRTVATKGQSASFVFYDTQPKPIYSYCKTDNDTDMMIKKIKEKVKISDWANSGCYCFSNGNTLAKYCKKIISAGEVQLSQDMKGEFYTSGVIAAMLRDGHEFVGLKVDSSKDVHVLGTPAQIKHFCQHIPNEIKGLTRPYRFVFDLDNTLVTHPLKAGDYTSCKPIKRNIEYCQELKKQGHYIIIATARRMRTHRGAVGAVVSDIGALTINQIEQFGIPHDEIHFGKPWGHFYVDDLNIDPLVGSLDKQLGFYFPSKDVLQGDSNAVEGSKPKSNSSNIVSKKTKDAKHLVPITKLIIFAAGVMLGAALAQR
mmetsp:Transcript_22/g.21  ORF Transcript_22/g.21 Transcript_22/m.21 type:complete len:372 (-) Transcript_22:392-1507(-)